MRLQRVDSGQHEPGNVEQGARGNTKRTISTVLKVEVLQIRHVLEERESGDAKGVYREHPHILYNILHAIGYRYFCRRPVYFSLPSEQPPVRRQTPGKINRGPQRVQIG